MTSVTPGVQSAEMNLLGILSDPQKMQDHLKNMEDRRIAAEKAEKSAQDALKELRDREASLNALKNSLDAQGTELMSKRRLLEVSQTDFTNTSAARVAELDKREANIKSREDAAKMVDADLNARKKAVEAQEANMAPRAAALANAEASFAEAQKVLDGKIAQLKAIVCG